MYNDSSLKTERVKNRPMERFLNKIETSKIVIGAIAVFVLFTIVYAIFAGVFMRSSISSLISEETDKAARKADDYFLKYTTISENSQNIYIFKDYLDSISSRADITVSEYYDEVMRILDTTKKTSGDNIELVWLSDINNNFIVYNGGRTTAEGWDVTTRPWYYSVVVGQQNTLTEPYASSITDEMIVSVIEPILSDDGKRVVGAFGMGLSNHAIAEALKSNDIGNAILLSNFGEVIYHFNSDYLFKNYTECNYSENLIEEIKKPSKSYIRFEENDESYIGMIKQFENCDYSVLTQISTSEVYGALKGDVIVVSIAGLVGLLMLVLLFVYYLNLSRKHRRAVESVMATDKLTGLDTSEKLSENITALLESSPNKNFVYISFNVKKFEVIGEVISFEIMNELISFIAEIMRSNLSNGELAGRVNTNEFAFVFEFESEKLIIDRLKGIVGGFVNFPALVEKEIHINFAFGAYVIEDHTLKPEVIIRRANVAKKMSISAFKSEYLFYNKDIEDKELYEQALEDDMERALETGEFKVFLQGKYDVNSDMLKGAEALVRWKHGKRGIISPSDFIPLFEENHFITRMDFYIYHKVGQIMSEWISQGIVPVPISVNMSRLHFSNTNIVNDFVEVIDKYKIPHRLIEVEITETALIGDERVLIRLVEKFHNVGIHVSIDDFGAGYSSLGLLKNLDVDTLKLDKNFFDNIENSVKDQNLVKNMIKLAADLEVDTVSEGIETKGQRDFLKKYGGQLIQGFYYSRPIPYEEFTEILK